MFNNYSFVIFGSLAVVLAACGFVESCQSNVDKGLTIEPVAGRFVLAEGPHWDHRSQHLYFVDIVGQKICRLDVASNNVTCTYIASGPVSFVIPVYDSPSDLVASAGKEFILVKWDGDRNVTRAQTEDLTKVDSGDRWNDGKADSHGRFWGGTIGPEVNEQVTPDQAAFYRITRDLKPKTEISPVTNSNGLAWNMKDDTLYYIDTPTRQIAAYDFDPNSGTISNKRIVFDLANYQNITGSPDGMTIDTDDNLWVALYGGRGVIHVDPSTGKLLRYVEIPAHETTSVTFGGPLLDILFVTTGSRGLSKKQQDEEPHAGYVFAVKGLGVRGSLANQFRL